MQPLEQRKVLRYMHVYAIQRCLSSFGHTDGWMDGRAIGNIHNSCAPYMNKCALGRHALSGSCEANLDPPYRMHEFLLLLLLLSLLRAVSAFKRDAFFFCIRVAIIFEGIVRVRIEEPASIQRTLGKFWDSQSNTFGF